MRGLSVKMPMVHHSGVVHQQAQLVPLSVLQELQPPPMARKSIPQSSLKPLMMKSTLMGLALSRNSWSTRY